MSLEISVQCYLLHGLFNVIIIYLVIGVVNGIQGLKHAIVALTALNNMF
jgi:hypothetical protein